MAETKFKISMVVGNGEGEPKDNRLASILTRTIQSRPQDLRLDFTDPDTFRATLPEYMRQARAAADKILAEEIHPVQQR